MTYPTFARFYVPLAMTSLLTLIALPIGSAAMSRMPDAIHSLDVWPVVNGLIFLLGSTGLAYQEVVVTLLDRPRAIENLRRFAIGLAAVTSGLLFAVALTPLSTFLFRNIMGLTGELITLSRIAILIGAVRPAFMVALHWFQGLLVHSHRTGAITEAIAIALIFTASALYIGATLLDITGIYVGVAAFVIGNIVQTLWLWLRSRKTIAGHRAADNQHLQYEKSTLQWSDQVID